LRVRTLLEACASPASRPGVAGSFSSSACPGPGRYGGVGEQSWCWLAWSIGTIE